MAATSVFERVKEILSPLLGEIMAKSTIKLHCKKLGIEADALKAADVTALASEIEKGMGVFVGSEKAKDLSQKIAELRG
jgi:hypothetical protein